MEGQQQPDRSRYFSRHDRDATKAKTLVAEVIDCNPELIKYYLVVAVHIDDSMAIAHSACCLPHITAGVLQAMEEYPELAEPRMRHHRGHPS